MLTFAKYVPAALSAPRSAEVLLCLECMPVAPALLFQGCLARCPPGHPEHWVHRGLGAGGTGGGHQQLTQVLKSQCPRIVDA